MRGMRNIFPLSIFLWVILLSPHLIAQTTRAFDVFAGNQVSPAAAPFLCGDVYEDGVIDISDVTLLFSYCFNRLPEGALLNLENADLDGYQGINIRDVAFLARYLFGLPGWEVPVCPPTQPEYQPTLSADDSLKVPLLYLPAGASSSMVPLEYKSSQPILALALPLQVRIGIDRKTPHIDSVKVGLPASSAELVAATIDSAAGTVNLGAQFLSPAGAGTYALLRLYFSIAPASFDRAVVVDTVPLSPSNHLLFILPGTLDGVKPVLQGFGPVPLYIQAFSPINLIVTDPDGESIGVSFNTIAGASYSAANDSIFIKDALPGDYKIKVVRDSLDLFAESTYSIDARIDGTADQVVAASEPVPEEGEVHNSVITYQLASPECLSKPGDANGDGLYTLSDLIGILNYLFAKAGCVPVPNCWLMQLKCRGDWNGDGKVDLTDVVRGINYMFKDPGGPWTPLPSGTCCLPVP